MSNDNGSTPNSPPHTPPRAEGGESHSSTPNASPRDKRKKTVNENSLDSPRGERPLMVAGRFCFPFAFSVKIASTSV